MPQNPVATSTCAPRLGPHHFAYLRAVAEGVDIADAARRYLGVEHGKAAAASHRAVVGWLQAVARRAGERRWRLIGLPIRPGEAHAQQPLLQDWAAGQGLLDWSEAELVELYAQAFPVERRAERNRRLRERQLAALRDLEGIAAEQPRAQDPLAAWFEPETARALQRAGLHTLDELRRQVSRGGRWWRGLPAIGPVKAARIAAHLAQLLPLPAPARFGPGAGDGGEREAIEAWIAAKAGSAATGRAYRREAQRLLLWAAAERRKPLAALDEDDCLAYAAFLERIPHAWISRRRARPMQPGWAPFAAQLSPASQRQSLAVLAAFFAWLVDTGRRARNPWGLPRAQDASPGERPAAAASPLSLSPARPGPGAQAGTALADWIEAQPPSASRERALFVLRFTAASGLRAGELVAARLGDLRRGAEGWTLRVNGRGERRRERPLCAQALRALERYLAQRGLPPPGEAPAAAPLLASLEDPLQPIGYQALYETMRAWRLRAGRGADLSSPAPGRAPASAARRGR